MELKRTLGFVRALVVCSFLTLAYYAKALYRTFFPKKRKCLRGEVILVTGASSGIGKAICKKVSEMGATLILWDINGQDAQELAESFKKQGKNAHAYQVDVTNRHEVAEVANHVRQNVGDVTMLFNNAGVSISCPMMDLENDDLEKTINVNLISHFWTLKAFLPKMLENRHGHVITIGSKASFYANNPFGVAYCASKFGVRGLIECLKHELYLTHENHNVKFTTAFPAFVDTPLLRNRRLNTKLGDYLAKKLDVENVAERIIDGVRRDEDDIHMPKFSPELAIPQAILPSHLRSTLERAFFTKIISSRKRLRIQ